MTLSPEQWRRIADYQDREIAALVDDRLEAERRSHLPEYARIGDWLPAARGQSVLELGCGPGRFVAMLAQLGYHVIGVDPIEHKTWECISERLPVKILDGICAEQLPFTDGEFDHVACLGALLYFEDPKRALSEVRRVIKPGGRLVLRTVNRRNLYTTATGRKLDPASHNLYSEEELCAFVTDSGFAVDRSFTYGFWPPIATMYWWYLVNGVIPQRVQTVMSYLTPRPYRVSISLCATRT